MYIGTGFILVTIDSSSGSIVDMFAIIILQNISSQWMNGVQRPKLR